MDAKIVAKGGILPIEIRDKYVDIVVSLVPENLESNVKKFYAFQSGGKLLSGVHNKKRRRRADL